MPLIYGEETRAFRRFQEIIKSTNDLTIFTWDVPQNTPRESLDFFAASPAAFAIGSQITPFYADLVEFTVTNKGPFISGDAPVRKTVVEKEGSIADILQYFLFVGTRVSGSKRCDGGIYLSNK